MPRFIKALLVLAVLVELGLQQYLKCSSEGPGAVCETSSQPLSKASEERLLAAAQAGDSSAFAAAVEHVSSSALLDLQDGAGHSVLHLALNGAYTVMPRQHPKGHLQVLVLALRAAPRLLEPRPPGPLCPLFAAVSLRVALALKPLLQLSDPDALAACLRERDANNNTVLMLAVRSQASGMSRLFLSSRHGVPERLRKDMGLDASALSAVELKYGPLTKACGYKEVQQLLTAGADPWERDGMGRNLWHIAALEGRAAIFKLLRSQQGDEKHGVAVASLAAGGWTPGALAAAVGFGPLAKNLGYSARSGLKIGFPVPPGGWTHQPSGGWVQSAIAKAYDVQKCDFEIVDCTNMSDAQFNESFLAANRPALLAGCTDSWAAHERWSRKQIVDNYGQLTLRVGQIAFPETYGLPGTSKQLAELAALSDQSMSPSSKAVPEFAFDAQVLQKTEGRIKQDFSPPPWVQHMEPLLTEFSFGPPLAGANMHFHGAAFNGLVHGRKRWALAPPAHAYFSTQPGRIWFDSPKSKEPWLLHCTQRAGDLLFIPRNWGHAVINIQTSVAIVNEYHF